MRPERDDELMERTEAALASAATRAGERLACHPGCTACCHGAFAISTLDVLRLRRGMAETEERAPELAERLKERARAWIAEHADEFPGDAKSGLLGESEEDEEAFEEFANDAPCPALNPETGHCDIYEARPMTCRLFGLPVLMEGGLGCCELCFDGAPDELIAECAIEPPHEVEEQILEGLQARGQTVVAYALLPPTSA